MVYDVQSPAFSSGSQSAGDGADRAAKVHRVPGEDGRVGKRHPHHSLQPQLPQPVSPAVGRCLVSTDRFFVLLAPNTGSDCCLKLLLSLRTTCSLILAALVLSPGFVSCAVCFHSFVFICFTKDVLDL